MGLMDKFKEQASQLAEKTQEAARDGKVRFDQAQAMRRADAMLRNLGALVYAERTGRAAPDTQAQQERLISDISAHEAQNGINLAPDAAASAPDAAASATGSSEAAPGYPPPQEPSSTFPPQESSTFPPSESQGFPPSDATGFPPSDPPGFPPSGGTTQV